MPPTIVVWVDAWTAYGGSQFVDSPGTGAYHSYLCDEVGKRTTSLLGYSAVFDNTNGIRATRGQRLSFSQDFAGLGGDVEVPRYGADRGRA